MANNWIGGRKMQTGHGLNSSPSYNGSTKGPLKNVLYVTVPGNGRMFSRDKVLLECGHEVYGTPGAARVRCWRCKQAAQAGEAK